MPILDWEALQTYPGFFLHLPPGLLQCTPHMDHPEVTTSLECNSSGCPVVCPDYTAAVRAALGPRFFPGPIQGASYHLYSLNSTGPGYLRNYLPLRLSAHPTRLDSVGSRTLPLNVVIW